MKYIFWTGGYDSTFRLSQLLIRYKKKVQPIYISDPNLDNATNQKTKRRNVKQELYAMKKIRDMLIKKFPYIDTQKLLMPLIIIKDSRYDDEIKKNMVLLNKKKYVRRSQCQYGGMAQVCKNIEQKVEVCAEVGGFFQKKLKHKIYCDNNNCYLHNFSDSDRCLSVFNKFLLPVINYTKENMYKESIEYNFNSILDQTWSCWYPRNNKPCNRCDMCKHRLKIYNNTPILEGFQTITNNNNNNNNILFIVFIVLYLLFPLIIS